MSFLARIPIWVWYLFSVAYCYVLWNPYYSLFHLLSGPSDPAVKTVMVMLVLIVGSLYIVEGHRTLNPLGIFLFMGFFGALFWLATNMGIHQLHSVQWWGQWIVGLLMTIALQGGRIYRALVGRVPVAGSLDEPHMDHQ